MHYKIGLKECVAAGVLVAAALLFIYVRDYGSGEQAGSLAALSNKITGQVRDEEKDKGKIALTFDDGPHPYYTEQILDGLKKRGIKATFFVTGMNAEKYPEIIKRMYEEGHVIGNHTFYHTQLTSKNRKEFKEELIRTNSVISGITGEDVIYVRPPYGSWDKKFETELNMFPVLWTIDPLDWCSTNVACITEKVVNKAEENDIILMHDYYPSTVTAAFNIIDELTKEGYNFVTVDEILFD